ncbi:hypothetical protein [Candidatus Uabimicrobium sp. HlEnr_7]|uniref:hypothetical protein n=1 Tax=Candidatus Uabimicrobium helgolandensis TaxID=3095367 RepID=UPI0035580E7F
MKFILYILVLSICTSLTFADVQVKLEKNTFKNFESIEVSYSNMPGESGEWANVIIEDAELSSYGHWKYTSGKKGTLTFDGQKAGKYQIRFFDKDSNLLVKKSIEIVVAENSIFELHSGIEVASFAQVFKGGWEKSVLEVTIVRVGKKEDHKYLVHFGGTIDHDWNGQVFPYRHNVQYARGEISRETYWTVINGERHNSIQGRRHGYSGMGYTIYIPGVGKGIKLYFSEELSKKADPKTILNKHLVATGQNRAIAEGKVTDPAILYKKIKNLENTITALKEKNTRISYLENKADKLEKKLEKQKKENEKKAEETLALLAKVKKENSELSKAVDTARNQAKKTQQPKPTNDVKITLSRLIRSKSDHFRSNGNRHAIYTVQILTSNYEKEKNAVVDASVKFWLGNKWVDGTLDDETPIPQFLPENSPSVVVVRGYVKTEDKASNIKVSLTLFSGHTIEQEFELK